MKPFENMKVAVCFMGQPRTYEHCADSINKFFQSNRGNTYHYFGHVWDTNTYKVNRTGNSEPYGNITLEQENNLDHVVLREKLNKLFNFEKLVIEKDRHDPLLWGNIFYSIMRANMLKQQYEAENDMTFDLVITHRYDLCYKPNTIFEDYINQPIQEKTIYSFMGHMRQEFHLPNPAQEYYYGTSLTMDLIDSFYNQLLTGSFDSLVGTNRDNPAWRYVGPGALIHKWAAIKNILFVHNQIAFSIYRKQTMEQGITAENDWEKCSTRGACIF